MSLKFGDKTTNICAGEENPHRHAYFVRGSRQYIECTDKKGNFWKTDKVVIVAGHIPYKEAEILYKPIWEKEFGGRG